MKALTVWHPWAMFIALGYKPIENRGWVPSGAQLQPGERFAIHAAARPLTRETVAASFKVASQAGTVDLNTENLATLLAICDATRGHLIATIEYTGAIRPGELGETTAADRIWWDGDGPGWVLRRQKLIAHPIKARGQQGLWNLPAEVEATVRASQGRVALTPRPLAGS